ncbi:hypothetical protein TTHERM_000395789 (macronuclear) [Tetrahymena thermophila SB210]|uniref:Uncharacterized protein n=1 Tax=Tetrahymena thermophila (strain SB210) TaxID=312017 RepID=W7X7X1_TETTS|nr:hypothetical protein TTHERM_000395789 [Tetrahymena thermophila SB210]EWS75480.1 hypothetical protein TTHERM_000395789 [Tetrahymena thermophila SB210]|eukprot:XP_012651949.1 hypothetical protein TTHERM_000395789 [Tetrahymena thermophila SB210]
MKMFLKICILQLKMKKKNKRRIFSLFKQIEDSLLTERHNNKIIKLRWRQIQMAIIFNRGYNQFQITLIQKKKSAMLFLKLNLTKFNKNSQIYLILIIKIKIKEPFYKQIMEMHSFNSNNLTLFFKHFKNK